MNVLKTSSVWVAVFLVGLITFVLGCGGGGASGDSSSGGSVTQQSANLIINKNISTTWRIQVVNGNSGSAIPGATFTWSPASEPTGAYRGPSSFLGTLYYTYQTNSNGEINLSGTISEGAATMPYYMNYNWTCSAPNLKTSSGYQEFSPSSWTLTGTTGNYNNYSGTLIHRILLYP